MDIEEQLEVANWAKRNGADVWNPDEVPPPYGDVYQRYSEGHYSGWWLVLAVGAFLAAMYFANHVR